MTTEKNKSTEKTSDREIVITRTFDASRELIWDAWTNPHHVSQWWGPKGFSTTIEIMEVKVGGAWKHVMHGPDGTDYPNKSIFTEVVKPERISYSHGGGGSKGGPGATFTGTWTFDALEANKTKVTIRMVFPTAAERDVVVKTYNAIEGGNQTLGRLAEHLTALNEGKKTDVGRKLTFIRTFDASRALVWKAWTDPKEVAKWWGPKGFTNPVCEMDLKPGGTLRIHMRGPEGTIYPMTGIFKEIKPPERLSFIASPVDDKGNTLLEILTTLTLIEKGGKTNLTLVTEVMKSSAQGHQMIQGMEMGWNQSLDRLVDLVAQAK